MGSRWFVRGDVDGFFGLFIDNLLQLMLIVALCEQICGLPGEFITQRIIPGAAFSILIGNMFYAWQAWRLMGKSGRDDVTALPYGINTPSLFAYIYLIMGPIYRQTQDYELAWQAGLFACFLSGVMEMLGAFVANWLRKYTPRAALLSALAGIAITFVAMGFIFELFASPAIAVVPMMLILFTYAGRIKLPLGLPGGLLAVLVGVILAWVLSALNFDSWTPPDGAYAFDFYPPLHALGDVFALFRDKHGWQFLAVIVPMGLFNVVGSLQNLESAEAAGDRYDTRSSLLANGIGTLGACFLGSPFPTTIYIGHPGWKAMGARASYSLFNGVVVTGLCLVGGITLVLRFVPREAMLGILLWIGIIMMAQAFETVPRRYALAVAFGLIPALAAWAYMLIITTVIVAFYTAGGPGSPAAAGLSLPELSVALEEQLIFFQGICALNQGYLLTSMIFAATLVYVIDRHLLKACVWMAVAAVLSMIGLIHAYELRPMGIENKFGFAAAPKFAIAYGVSALVLLGLHFMGYSEDRNDE